MTPLVIPPQMPPTSRGRVDYYEIAVRQFKQQILPAGLRDEGVELRVGQPRRNLQLPAFTIEAHYHRPVRIKWINELVDKDGDFLPHLLPVDPTCTGQTGWCDRPRLSAHTFDETLARMTGRFRS